jgi:hypothetical protein
MPTSVIRPVATQLLPCESAAATRAMQDLYEELQFDARIEVLYETLAKLNFQLGAANDQNMKLAQENDDLHECVNTLHEKFDR